MRGNDAEDYSAPLELPLLSMANTADFTPQEIATYYAIRVPNLNRRAVSQWRGPCPIHKGQRDSFAVDSATGRWFCHSTCGRGGSIYDLEVALGGADFNTARASVFDCIGRPNKGNSSGHGRIVEVYDYTDETGRTLFQCVRYEPKAFRQRRPNGSDGWLWNLNGVRLVLYRLPNLLKRTGDTVFICEGEKDVHAVDALGLLATCNPMGVGKWRPEYTKSLRGRSIAIFPDNDPATDEQGKPHYKGQKHAGSVAAELLGFGCEVRIIEVPVGKDVSDWLAVGLTREVLENLITAMPPLDHAKLATWRLKWETPTGSGSISPGSAAKGSLAMRRILDIEAKPVSWLWPGRIARGKLTIIAGQPGLGKSQITASIAAVVTTGGRWPVDRQQCEPGHVLFLSAEDDPADTLRPRLEAAGADLSRVHFVDGVTVGYTGDGTRASRIFSLQEDIQALSDALDKSGEIVMIIIDPITAYLGDTDSHKNSDVRGLLAPLSELAARHEVSIIGVSHLTKAAGGRALMRVTGSLAFVAAARAAYLVTRDPHSKTKRLFLPMKNNLARDATGLAFEIEGLTVSSPAGKLETSRILWDSEPVPITADEAMQAENGPAPTSALREATDWLQQALDRGPVAANDLFDQASMEGISRKTLQRASKVLKVKKEKRAMAGGWDWSSAAKVANYPEDGQL